MPLIQTSISSRVVRICAYLTSVILGTTAVLVAVAAGVIGMLMSLQRLAPVLVAASAAHPACGSRDSRSTAK